MSFRKHKVALMASAAAAAVVLVVQIGASGAGQGAYKMEGAWVARVVGSPGQWTYTLSPDPSGRRAAITGFIQAGIMPGLFGLFTDAESISPIVGEAVMTEDGTVVFNSVWYGIKKGFPVNQIVFIGTNNGRVRATGPGKAEGTHNLKFYAPDSDQDGDGLPDPGATPVLALPSAITVETRLPL